MPAIVYRIVEVLSPIVMDLPIGTNLALWHVLWALISGRLLAQRGAIIPALAASGLRPEAVRRAWTALAYGAWDLWALLAPWLHLVKQEGRWHAHRQGGYRPVAVDLVGFFRPRLKDCATKHYLAQAGKALPAISFGIVAAIGSVGQQVIPLLRAVVRHPTATGSEKPLLRAVLAQAGKLLLPDEILLTDRGFPLRLMSAAGIPRFAARVAKNFTGRRATPPAYAGRGRPPTRGELVRPLPRSYRGHRLCATPPDRSEHWLAHGRPLRADFWDNLVTPNPKGSAEWRFTCVVIYDPAYQEPLLLVTNVVLTGPQLHALYLDRWPIEQIPLTAKQLLGAGRQFVFADAPRQRLPELSLFASSLLMYLAATQTVQPTGFWDRQPRPTAGRLRRTLARLDYSDFWPLPEQVRKKHSVTAHLPKGVAAHRRIPAQPVTVRHRSSAAVARV
jgi:hypothetical protein